MKLSTGVLENLKELVKDEKYRMPRDIATYLLAEVLYYRNRDAELTSPNKDLGITEGSI